MSEALLVILALKTGFRAGDLLERVTNGAVQEKLIYRGSQKIMVPHIILVEKKTEHRKKPAREVTIDHATLTKITQHTEFLVDNFPNVRIMELAALPVFCNPKTLKPLTRQWADNRLRGGARRETKLGNALRQKTTGHRISTHSLRKTYAHKLYQHTGHNIEYVRKSLGHSTARITQHYLNIAEADHIDIHLEALRGY
jgi:integrase